MTVFQHVVELNSNDGIGNDIIGISERLFKLNINNKIITNSNKSFIDNIEILNSKELKKINFKPDDIHILHYGSPGYPIRDFRKIYGKKILRFHNITPYAFSYGFCSTEIFKSIRKNYQLAIMELISLNFDINEIWFDSHYNKYTYHEWITKQKVNKEFVVPIFRDYQLSDNNFKLNSNILFTGRIVPSKKIEDLIFIQYFLKKINSLSKLYIVGKTIPIYEKYSTYIKSLIMELKLENDIELYHNITDTELNLLRADCSIYLSMSEHEGFCIPILESFAAGLPVVAFSAGAVSETMRGAGILIKEKSFLQISYLINSIIEKNEIRNKIQIRQHKELEFYAEERNIENYL